MRLFANFKCFSGLGFCLGVPFVWVSLVPSDPRIQHIMYIFIAPLPPFRVNFTMFTSPWTPTFGVTV